MAEHRSRAALAVLAGLVLLALVVHPSGHGARAAGVGGADPLAQPVLGTADRSTVLMGAATAGTPGEAWAYRVLQLDVSPPDVSSGQAAFAPVSPGDTTPPGQLVFERATDAAPDWTIQETPVDEEGNPYRGMEPDRLSPRITPHGGGLLLGQDTSRPTGKQIVVLVRNPGARFRMVPAPAAGILLAAGEGGEASAETLAEKEGAGAVADAAVEGGAHTEAYFGALGRKRELGVARWDGEHWSRETVEPPAGYSGGFQIVAIAGSSPANMWLVAKADANSGLGVLLFKRKEVKSGEFVWQSASLGAPLFAASETLSRGVTALAPLSGAAQPLTVSEKGVWIDGNMQALGGGSDGFDFTLYYDVAQEKVTGSWCDARDSGGEALCEHPFDARFGRFAGYRSFAFDGQGFGVRIITNPLLPGGDDTTNLGSYLRLEGTTFERMPGAGANNAGGGAFYSPDDGWLEGPVQVTKSQPPTRLVSWPVSARAPFTAVAPAPGSTPGDPGAQALAVGADGAVARYTPGHGWEREFLLTGSGAVSAPTLRAVAWPDPNRAFAVGNLGAMWIWRSETGLWEKDPATPLNGFQGNLDGIAFAPGNPGLGYAVGQDGVLLAYGKSWEQEELPSGFSEANFTSVTFAGSEAMVAAEHDLLTNDGTGWKVDPEAHALLRSLPSVPTLNVVAGLPNGGAVAAGHDVVLERDSAGAPWHFSEQPIVDETAIAAAPYLEGAKVRALISVVPYFTYPEPFVLPPVDPNTPPPLIPPNPLPGDGYVLRETPAGWEDEERANYAGDTSDKPIKADPVAAFDVGTSGVGWAVGGWSGEADDADRGSSASGGSGQQVRENVQTAGIYSFSPSGDPQGPPGEDASAIALAPGVATFAVGGHAECIDPCASLADEAIAPDRNLSAALSQIDSLSTQSNGPRMLLYTGGRETPGEGIEPMAEAERYAQLLAGGGSLPVYPALSAGDSEGGSPAAFGAAFSSFAAPFGQGGTPGGVSTAAIPAGPGAGPGARTHYAFDSSGQSGTVRVIVIDNSRGSLATSDPYQNPAQAQGPWLAQMLADAKARGIPAIVVGSRELNPSLPPALNVASDAGEEAEIMVQGGASAYLYERPEESRASRIPSGAAVTIPEFGTGALGYRSSISDSFKPGQPDSLFGTTGYLMFSVDVAKRDAATNVAPVSARLIPLVQSVSLDPVDGTLLRRSAPALFTGLGRRPIAGDRWGPISASDGSPNPPGADPYSEFPPALCRQSDCSTAIEPEYTFTSSEPEIANFVEQDPNSSNLRKPLQDSSGHVIPDPHSGILCAFNAGTTTVTISAGGLSYSTQVTVLGGSVEQPCGTVPLSASHFKTQAQESAAAPSSPPPSPAPAPAPIAPPPPPPPVVPAKAPAPKPAPKVALPLAILPIVKLPSTGAVPVVPPPPAAAFADPIPPGGATVRVFEEKREEEAAPESSQAFARAPLHPEQARSFASATHVIGVHRQRYAFASAGAGSGLNVNKASSGIPLYLLALVLFMAAGGASIRIGPGRRRRAAPASLSLADDRFNQRPRRRR
ncbi:MAG: WD40/YVTN/BNR-like repeat-containing protein [Solirubrobacteraceae bacterium]